MSGLVDEGREVDIFFLDFSEAFNTVSPNIFIEKLLKCEQDEQTVMPDWPSSEGCDKQHKV